MPTQGLPPVPQLTAAGFTDPTWARWLDLLRAKIVAVATSIVINTANGFNGTVTVDPSGQATITLGVTVAGLLKGQTGGIVAAVAGVDYVSAVTASSPLHSAPGGGGATNLTIDQSGPSQDGYLSASDWNTFNNKLSGNQTITLSGDATGSGATAITVTLATVLSTPGTFGDSTHVPRVTFDAKGRATAVSSVAIASAPVTVGNTASRPASPPDGLPYLDTTLGQPIWALATSGTGWINAAGVAV
jgi:hypothetical protein